jgi:5'/3'-nucleotidase SurE
MYGLDVLAQQRRGKRPDLVLSGPNEGQNTGRVVNSSGTIANAQFAAARGIPAIALSAGFDTVDNTTLADPDSAIVAQLTVKLLQELEAQAGGAIDCCPEAYR